MCVSARMMSTAFWNESVRMRTIAPSTMFMDTDPPSSYSALELLKGPNDNAFVNTYALAGRYFAVTDSPFAVEVDLESLGVIDDVLWQDDLDETSLALGSAHPLEEHREDGRRCIVGVRPQMDLKLLPEHAILLYRVCADAPTTREPIAAVNTGEQFAYLHSFGLSRHHAVLPLQPLHMDMGKMMHGHPTVLEALQPYHPEAAMPIIVQPLAGGAPIRFELPQARYFVHVVNTFELVNATAGTTAIVMDLTLFGEDYFATTSLAAMRNATARNQAPMTARAQVTRWTMHLDGPRRGQVDVRPLSVLGRATDFPNVHPAYRGRSYCFYYAVEWFHDDKTSSRMAVVKQDVCTGARRYWYREGLFPSEPTLVPREGGRRAEDDGRLLFTALEGDSGISSLVVVDARTMATLSQVPMPIEAALGFTVHGQFYE